MAKDISHEKGEYPAPAPGAEAEVKPLPDGPPDDMPLPGVDATAPAAPMAPPVVAPPQPTERASLATLAPEAPAPVAPVQPAVAAPVAAPAPAIVPPTPCVAPEPSRPWYAYHCPKYMDRLPPRFAHDADEQLAADEHGAIVMCKHCKQWHRAVAVKFPVTSQGRTIV